MDRRATPPKRVTSPTWGTPPPCKQALRNNGYAKLCGQGKQDAFMVYVKMVNWE